MQVNDYSHVLLVNPIKAETEHNIAEIDQAFPTEARRQAEDILIKNKAHYYFQIFSGASHGFGARGDPADDAQRASFPFSQRIYPPTSELPVLQALRKRNARADSCTGSTGSQRSHAYSDPLEGSHVVITIIEMYDSRVC